MWNAAVYFSSVIFKKVELKLETGAGRAGGIIKGVECSCHRRSLNNSGLFLWQKAL